MSDPRFPFQVPPPHDDASGAETGGPTDGQGRGPAPWPAPGHPWPSAVSGETQPGETQPGGTQPGTPGRGPTVHPWGTPGDGRGAGESASEVTVWGYRVPHAPETLPAPDAPPTSATGAPHPTPQGPQAPPSPQGPQAPLPPHAPPAFGAGAPHPDIRPPASREPYPDLRASPPDLWENAPGRHAGPPSHRLPDHRLPDAPRSASPPDPSRPPAHAAPGWGSDRGWPPPPPGSVPPPAPHGANPQDPSHQGWPSPYGPTAAPPADVSRWQDPTGPAPSPSPRHGRPVPADAVAPPAAPRHGGPPAPGPSIPAPAPPHEDRLALPGSAVPPVPQGPGEPPVHGAPAPPNRERTPSPGPAGPPLPAGPVTPAAPDGRGRPTAPTNQGWSPEHGTIQVSAWASTAPPDLSRQAVPAVPPSSGDLLPYRETSERETLPSRRSGSPRRGRERTPRTREKVPAPHPRRKRDPYLDNVKFVLISLVVTGHSLVPTLAAHSSRAAYMFIYMFHMPAFVLISGYLGRNFWNSNAKINKLVDTMLVPYAFVEIGYALLRFALGQKWTLTIIDPAWLNWYLVALVLWRISTPIWTRMRQPLLVAVVIYMLAGFSEISGDFSLDRFFGLLPFYVLGLLLKPEHFDLLKPLWVKAVAGAVLAGGAVVAVLIAPRVGLDPVYFRYSFKYMGMSWGIGLAVRGAVLVAALALSVAVLALVPRRETWFSDLGTRTLYTYLLHGVVVLIVKDLGWLGLPWLYGPLGVLAIASCSLVLAIALSTPMTRTLFKWLLEPRLTWLYRRPAGTRREGTAPVHRGDVPGGSPSPAERTEPPGPASMR
ncbi:hypothetical protein GCM10017673_17070 [Streptosporangium violaceochromogenes]|nr:hypothetical protein GCM10017673_17070 [Streptosporangium violaceochromogenes]